MRSCLSAMFLFLSVFTGLKAQVIPHKKYTSKDGLLSDRITAIAQDQNGFMWFGSYFGICRYNGIKFENINLDPSQQNKYVTCFLPVGDKMYAGFIFGGGLAEFSKGKLKAWFIQGKDSASSNEFVCMSDNGDGSILVCNSASAVYEFRNGVFTHLYTLKRGHAWFPRSLQKDQKNTLWLATDNGLYIVPYPYKTEQVFFPGDYVFSLTKDENDKIWFCRSKNRKTILETHATWSPGTSLQSDHAKELGNLSTVPFSGHFTKGFWAIDQSYRLVNIAGPGKNTFYDIPLDPSTDISTLYVDREHNIWIANEPGVVKLSNFGSRSFLFDELAAGGGAVLLENDSLLWATNARNLYTIQSDRLHKIKTGIRNEQYFGNFYKDSQGFLWIALWNQGVWKTKWEKGRLAYIQKFENYNNVAVSATAITEDSSGTIWLAGFNGLFGIRKNRIEIHLHPRNLLGKPASISAMVIDEKNKTMWLGDNAVGLIQLPFDRIGNRIIFKQTSFITAANGLKDNYIRSMLVDHKNDLWIGTRFGGIYKISKKSTDYMLYDLTSDAKLNCTRVTDIKRQDTTALWFATCNGIHQYQYATNQWKHLSTSDGLLNTETYAVAPDGKNEAVWVLTAQGLTRLSLHQQGTAIPPLVTITSVTVLGQPDTMARFSSVLNKYSYRQNSIGFSFAGASFIDEKMIRYRYQLEGYDKKWSDPVNTNAIFFASLPPGRYTFKVIAANAGGIWSQPATYHFQVIKPFYLSPWFYVICVTIAIAIFYFIRMQRLRQRYKIEKLRLAIAKDLHDDIGSTLGSINLLSQTASRRMTTRPAEDIIPIFQKISHSAENTLEAMDDIVWSINPEKDNVQDLVIRMREFAIPLLEAKNINHHFNIQAMEQANIPMNLRRNVFLIFKEGIHNIIKHAEASEVTIFIQVDYNALTLRMTDNGKGFSITETRNRNGLKNLRSRSEAVDGILQIASTEHGTTVFFTAPI